MISAPGIGSGLDLGGLVSQLVAAEGDAKTAALASKRSDMSTKISAFGSLKSALSSFQSSMSALTEADTFTSNTATSGDTEVFTVSATGTSLAANSYQVEVQTLAESQRLITAGFTDADTVVGTGELTITVGSDSFTVTIDSSNDTLSEIGDAINAASDNTGVTASVLNVDDGFGGTETKLVLTSDDTGTDNEITVTVDDDDLSDTNASGLSAFYYDPNDATSPEQLSVTNAAVDAVILIDGQQVTSSSNTIADAIEGVSINLLATVSPGETVSLTIEHDSSKISSAVSSFVSSFNTLATTINQLTVYDEETGAVGILLGDNTLLGITSNIRRQLTDSVDGLSGDITNLVNIGITTNTDGTLAFDSSELSDAIDSDLTSVTSLFSSDDGIAKQLDDVLDELLKSDGTLDSKIDGLNNTIEDIDESLVDISGRLDTLEQRLTAQFSALDLMIARMNTTSNFLTQQLSMISNITNSQNN